jgi:hypothetical protein
MVRFGFPTTWKVAIEFKRKGNQWNRSNNSFTIGQQKMSLHHEFNLRERWRTITQEFNAIDKST